MNEFLLNRIRQSLAIACDWEAKGNPDRANRCYHSVLDKYISVSVTEYNNANDGVDFLVSCGFNDILSKYVKNNRLMFESVRTAHPFVGSPSCYNSILYLSFALLVNAKNLIDDIMATIAIPIVKEGDGRFWSEFSEGIMAMVQKRSFLVSPMKYRGYEKYWAIYLDFISDVTNNRNISNSLALMSDGFQKRNKDMRLNESGCPIDGSGNTPVKWDFRGESLKKYAAEAYGLNFGLTS